MFCQGESIRILRAFPGSWTVFVQIGINTADGSNTIEWRQVGTKDVIVAKPSDWQNRPENKRDGGVLFNHGQPTYQEVAEMLNNSDNYTPKSPAERAAAAFTFLKDSLQDL
jgi:hypothetical protein